MSDRDEVAVRPAGAVPATDGAASRRVATWVGRGLRHGLVAVEHLCGGLGTGILALFALAVLGMVAAACLLGVGLLVLPAALRLTRAVADRERARLSRWGPEIVDPYPDHPLGPRARLADPATRRDLGWLVGHALLGPVLGLLGLLLPLLVVRDASVPIWWWMVPPWAANASVSFIGVHSWPSAFGVAVTMGLGWLAILVVLGPRMARVQAVFGRWLLPPHPSVDLSTRIATLTATRAAALDAHGAELRRIERSLHDGTQNRLVGTTVLIGAARRALQRDPAHADEILERAQDAAEQALAELRGVLRGILPPVLAERGLDGALDALVAACPVDCRVRVDLPGRCAASVEATAYYTVAEALTNVAKHSGARHARVTVRRHAGRLCVRVTDDGHGGADARDGTGIDGIRRRVEAFDGSFAVTSPPGGPTVLEVELPCGS